MKPKTINYLVKHWNAKLQRYEVRLQVRKVNAYEYVRVSR